MDEGVSTRPKRGVADTRRLREGAVLGRYVVVRFIGAGGNGEVWAAYDQTLRRTVALKLLREAEAPDGGWSALLDEAQNLARLSHPNVVAVHDVVRDGTRVFISMELVDGVDLGQWLRAESRSRSERLAVLLDAGRGLQAAHDSGVVHGDFKPANVLVDASGRPRVVDFGLAQIERSQAPGSGGGGTAPYMAPEQHAGALATTASDQYAFAVTTFEALADAMPFTAGSESALASRKQTPPDAAAAVRLPARLRSVLERALRPLPGDRYPSVRALVEALEAGARPRRRVLPLAALGVVGIAGVAWMGSATREEPCRDIDRELEGVWDPAQRERLLAAFAHSEHAWGPDVASTTVAQLDGYARSWLDARRALCEQHQGPSPLPRNAYALRRVCLDADRAALASAIELLTEDDEPPMQRAVEIVGGLPRAEACLDVEVRVPRKVEPTPDDLPELEAIQAELARISVLRAAGRYDAALEKAEALRARATEVGDLHDAAMAMLEVADLRDKLDHPEHLQSLHDALSLALSSGRDDVLAKVASSLAWRAADDTDLEDARRWIAHAEAATHAAGDAPELIAFVENARSHVHGVAGDTKAEVEAARSLVAAVEASSGTGSEQFATAANTLAISLYRHGELDEAADFAEQAVAGIERLLGASHPRWATYALTLGGIRVSQARYAEAFELLQRAHAVAVASYGEQHSTALTIAGGLATAAAYAGDFEAAARLHRDVLDARLAAPEPDALLVATSRLNLGIALHRLDRLDEAARELDAARAAFVEKLGVAHPRVPYVRALLADVRVDQGRIAEAEPELEALARELDEDGSELAVVRFALARARAAREPGSPEALALARRARETFSQTPGFAIAVDRIDAWIERFVQPH